MEDKQSPGEVLRNIIWHRHRTIRRFAAKKKVNPLYLGRMLKNCQNLSARQRWRLAMLFEMPLEELNMIISGEMDFLDWLNKGKLRI